MDWTIFVRTARNAAVGPASRAARAVRHVDVDLGPETPVFAIDEFRLPRVDWPYRLFSEILIVIMGCRVPFLSPKDKWRNGLFLLSHCFVYKNKYVSVCSHIVFRVYFCCAASTTAKVVIFTIRRGVADGVRICTGFAAPNKIGPIAIPLPAAVFSKL